MGRKRKGGVIKMAIHTTRDNFAYGIGDPSFSAKFYGQIYIDTATNPRTVWIAGAENSSGWLKLPSANHKHTVKDFADLQEKIVEIVQQEGIEAALVTLKGGNNLWEGAWNNFTNTLRVQGKDVLSKGSSIGDLADVDTTNLKANSLLGWNGSNFVAYEVGGASPSDGGIDFSVYLRKDELVPGFDSSATNKPLAASAGKAIIEKVKAEYASKDHTHTGFASAFHTHTEYYDKTKAQSVKGGLSITSSTGEVPLKATNSFGGFEVILPQNATGPGILSFINSSPDAYNDVVIGGKDGSGARRLTLNFDEIRIPNGGLTIGETKRNINLPPIRISEKDLTYVGTTSRKPALNLNGGAMNGTSQIVFRYPSKGRDQGILFPKDFAGYGEPVDSQYYHYLRLTEGQMKTDTALSSEKKYIELGGVRIFFSNQDPGREAREGDIWITV